MKNKILIFLSFLILSCGGTKVATEQKRFILDNKNKEKYYLIDYINTHQSDNRLGLAPTLVIYTTDGQKIIRSDQDFEEKLGLKKDDIKRMEIIPVEKSIGLFGSAGANGVINIYTYHKPE